MENDFRNDLFDALDGVLEQERDALLAGDLEKIARLLEYKESLIENLSISEELEARMLQELTGKMKRNQDLLDSALEGIRSVSNRLAALRRVRSSLDTYDSNGTKRSIDIVQDSTLEKRA